LFRAGDLLRPYTWSPACRLISAIPGLITGDLEREIGISFWNNSHWHDIHISTPAEGETLSRFVPGKLRAKPTSDRETSTGDRLVSTIWINPAWLSCSRFALKRPDPLRNHVRVEDRLGIAYDTGTRPVYRCGNGTPLLSVSVKQDFLRGGCQKSPSRR